MTQGDRAEEERQVLLRTARESGERFAVDWKIVGSCTCWRNEGPVGRSGVRCVLRSPS